MARNRKRARQPHARDADKAIELGPTASVGEDETPGSLVHAAPDVELAEIQAALGRPDLARGAPPPDDGDAEVFADELDSGRAGGGGGGGRGALTALPSDGGAGAAPAAEPEHRPGALQRLVGFLQGSWKELHRVQWPDRRQTMQATGVVLGFVIIAGVYLGVADYVAQQIVNFILK